MKQFAWLKAARSYLLPGATLAAGVAALASGVLPLPAFGDLAGRTIPILAFVLAMSLVTELVDEAGLFRVVTDRLATGRTATDRTVSDQDVGDRLPDRGRTDRDVRDRAD